MFDYGNNNKIEISKVLNGYLITIINYEAEKPLSLAEQFEKIAPVLEKLQNKMQGDDWKNKMQDEVNELIQPKKEPLQKFIAYTWEEVLEIINKANF